ncbi:TnsD family Tn7-like transposition protein [Tepidibacter sp. Z1-5]|uniref:TnsD family Tn7-like transposition protein n=1 Tax=Tepidibacter sp. Z1-5 TaxID=3134138 RepID=UPI0030BF790C
MLTFFTDPYENELLYGAIGRYHYYIGNIDYKDTLREVFRNESVIPSIELCARLDTVANNLGGKYTADYIINNHTIFPFYAPFIPKTRREELINDMKYKDGKGIYAKTGILAGSVCKKEGIYYCPLCSEEEINKYGEAYIHREHQLQGVFVCPHNGAKLKKYKIDRTNSSRLEFIRLNEKLLDLNAEYEENKDIYEKLLKISKTAYYILNNNLYQFNKDTITKKYKEILYSKGLVTTNKRIKQRELYDEFIKYYGVEFLEIMESSIDKDNEYNWLKVITRNSKRTVHPIRHILFIIFLVDDIKEFFKSEVDEYNPFGKSPWPCLNYIAGHYKNDVVTELTITTDYKTRRPIGTFTCDCGFIYSRKGPDKVISDRYKIGRIKEFGSLWEETLKEYLLERKYGLRELARIMNCDPKTIVKFDKELGINYYETSNMRVEKQKNNKKENKGIDIQAYKENILTVINQNSSYTRTQIRELCKKEYTYLYRHDKAWLLEILPKNISRKNIDYKSDKRVNWKKRDIEILNIIKEQYKSLLLRDKPIRITKGNLCKESGILTIIEKKLDKLPRTKEYLDDILESVEEFQLRRARLIADEKLEGKEGIRLWEIQKLSRIRTSDFEKIKTKLEQYIDGGE